MANEENRPHPEDSRKPDSVTDIEKPSWKIIAKNTLREFGKDQLTDVGAGLTYYTVLSIFPGLIALVSILSLFGQSGQLIQNLLDELQGQGVLPASAMDTLKPAMATLLEAPAPGVGLIIGILTALWAASNYVKAFSRGMNRIYEMPEGRGAVKYTLTMYGLTALILVLMAAALVIVTVSGPFAESLGNVIGLGQVAMTVWAIAKWPILLLCVLVSVALLYYITPNVEQPKFRWVSIGAAVAILVAAVASAALALYLVLQGNSSYAKTYGPFAGVIVFLLWMYIVNVSLLFGGELDAELERGRQLQAGIPAEEKIQLPARDTTASDKKEEKAAEAVEQAREYRIAAAAGKTDHDPTKKDSDKDADGDGSGSKDSSESEDEHREGAHQATKDELKQAKEAEEAAKRTEHDERVARKERAVAELGRQPKDHFAGETHAEDATPPEPREPKDHYPNQS